MIERLRSHITYANVIASIALFVALSGTATATGVLGGSRMVQHASTQVQDSKKKKKKKKTIKAVPGPQGKTGSQGLSGAKGDKGESGTKGDQGVPGAPRADATKLWAGVRDNGTLSRGSGVASTTRLSAGFYTVTFSQDVSSCGFSPSLGNPDYLGIGGGGIAAAQNLAGGFSNLPTQVLVVTTDSAGVNTDRPFFLFVFC